MTREGADDRRRDRDGGDERRAEVAQEDEDDDRGEDAAEDEVLLDRGSDALMNSESSRTRRTSTFGGSVCWISAIRALIASASATVLTPLCLRMATVSAGLPSSIETEVGSSPPSTTRPMSRIRIGELPRVATTRSLKASGVAQPADRPHRQVAVALLEPAAGQLEVLRPQRRRDVGGREPVGVQPVGIDLDLDLTPSRAEEQHFADAVDRLEPLLHVLLEERRQLDDRHRRRHREHDDRQRIRVLLLDDRRIRGFRQIADDRIDLGPDFLCRDVGVLREVEGDGDARAAFRRRRAQLVDAGDGVDGRFDAVGDLGLDVLRRRAGFVVVTDTTGVSTRG